MMFLSKSLIAMCPFSVKSMQGDPINEYLNKTHWSYPDYQAGKG